MVTRPPSGDRICCRATLNAHSNRALTCARKRPFPTVVGPGIIPGRGTVWFRSLGRPIGVLINECAHSRAVLFRMEATGRLCAESTRPTPGIDRRPPILTPHGSSLRPSREPRRRALARRCARRTPPGRGDRAAPRRGPPRAGPPARLQSVPKGPTERAKNFAAVELPVRPKRAAEPARARRVRGALTRRAAGGAQVGRDEAVLFPDGAREGRG